MLASINQPSHVQQNPGPGKAGSVDLESPPAAARTSPIASPPQPAPVTALDDDLPAGGMPQRPTVKELHAEFGRQDAEIDAGVSGATRTS